MNHLLCVKRPASLLTNPSAADPLKKYETPMSKSDLPGALDTNATDPRVAQARPTSLQHARRTATVAGLATALTVGVALGLPELFTGSAVAQQQIQPQRIGQTPTQTRQGVTGGVNQVDSGRGNTLGDGTGMGGQTFSWTRGRGAGQRLGAGNALDKNSQVGSGGTNQPGQAPDFYSRNLVVTKSVPGGRGFRGAVGYLADKDFRGVTATDSTYAFRADSALSNPVFINSAVARDRFLVAQGLGVFEFRRDSTPIGYDQQRAANARPDSSLRVDRANAQMAFGRMNWDLGEDRTVARGEAANGEPIRYIVSPLRGLQAESLKDPIVRSGIGVYEQARVRADMRDGFMKPDDLARGMTPPGIPSRIEGQISPMQLGDELRVKDSKLAPQSYLELRDALEKKASEKAGLEKGGLDRVRRTMDGTRLEGGGAVPGEAKPGTTPSTTPSTPPAPGSKPSDSTTSATQPSLIAGGGTMPESKSPQQLDEEKREEVRGKLLPVPEMAEILRHGKKFSQLGTDERRRVDELVRQGEQSLRDGEYFQAERRFDQALAIAADNPLVEAGIAHAQIGSGLYLSAGLTLKNLFEARPELIDARYDAALLPKGERLNAAVTLMRERITKGDDAPGYGLVLAYIGHQTENRALVEEGLKAITGTEKLDRQSELLKGVWLGGK